MLGTPTMPTRGLMRRLDTRRRGLSVAVEENAFIDQHAKPVTAVLARLRKGVLNILDTVSEATAKSFYRIDL
jgi:hypothetical protein